MPLLVYGNYNMFLASRGATDCYYGIYFPKIQKWISFSPGKKRVFMSCVLSFPLAFFIILAAEFLILFYSKITRKGRRQVLIREILMPEDSHGGHGVRP